MSDLYFTYGAVLEFVFMWLTYFIIFISGSGWNLKPNPETSFVPNTGRASDDSQCATQ
jgi:bacteriorhodopsin